MCRYSCYSIAAQIYAAKLGLEPGDAFEIKLGCMQIELLALAAVEKRADKQLLLVD
ncbi:hypothetical protein KBY72_12970 [Cyanobium sp. BA5m-21]|uniref:AbrB family transcriptional regulator n=1 Tax=Cyanobium sp. BA5m-21 TaxID=2823706 RepID=UPI0020CC901C|nr:AbrB family transcriptional regulator [Cyanobium sp. BA5m-21]MCP9908081.1 hypothetical protein [Cyanobium sp. BA5m-21]